MNKKKVVLDDFAHTLKIRVAWGDMDAFGHINNILFFRYFEEVRISYFEKANILYKANDGIGPILAESSCKFIRPIYYPSNIIAGASISLLEDDRFEMLYGLFNEKSNECCAIGNSFIMAFDYIKKTKVKIPLVWVTEFKKINKDL